MSANELENTRKEIPITVKPTKKKMLDLPIPLRWGILALVLFGVFAAITFVQFNRISDDRIFSARVDAYLGDIATYNFAVKAHEECINELKIDAGHLKLFSDIDGVFQEIADLTAKLDPADPVAKDFKTQLTAVLERSFKEDLAKLRPERTAADCPSIPENKPEKPTR